MTFTFMAASSIFSNLAVEVEVAAAPAAVEAAVMGAWAGMVAGAGLLVTAFLTFALGLVTFLETATAAEAPTSAVHHATDDETLHYCYSPLYSV